MADTRNGPELHPMTEELATGKNFAAVTTVQYTGRVSAALAYRSPLIPAINSNALSVQATSLGMHRERLEAARR